MVGLVALVHELVRAPGADFDMSILEVGQGDNNK